jgi:hypothetical protein
MMRSWFVLAFATALLAPLPAAAQGGGQGQGRPGGMGGLMAARALLEQGSVEFLAARSAELRLTAGQTAALAAIGEKWAGETKPARDRIRAELPVPGQAPTGDRQAMMERLQALAPVMQQLQEEDRRTLAEAMELLDEAQQAAARKLLEERTAPRRPAAGRP